MSREGSYTVQPRRPPANPPGTYQSSLSPSLMPFKGSLLTKTPHVYTYTL